MNDKPEKIITEYGNVIWKLNGVLHREDGPAAIYVNGDETWYLNGKWHREDGPAFDWIGAKSWCYHGKYIPCKTQQEFERLLRLKAFW
jgi:hypothetical protein